jgi:hypothetical protein
MMATASFIIPSPKRTAFKTGYFYGFISDIAATVSVAHRTLLNINTYFRVKVLKITLSTKLRKIDNNTNPIIVPITPKKLIIPKF